MDDDIYDDPQFRAFVKDVREDLIPKLKDSAVVVSLVPDGETDVKYAVELGLSIMLDKSIIAVVGPGVHVPPKLAKVVDHFVEGDITTDEGRTKLSEVLNEIMRDES